MKLVTEWRRVLLLSLSFWMQVVGLLVLIAPEARYYWTGEDYDPYLAWWAGVLLLVAGIVGRLMQQGVSLWWEWLRLGAVVLIIAGLAFVLAGRAHAAPPAEAETLAVAVPFIEREEGMVLTAYRDVVGVWTICSGSTRGVRPSMTKTLEECRALLRAEVAEYRRGLHRYFTAATVESRLTQKRDTAYTSTAFNCGIAAIGNSTATRRLNAGDIAGGCEALTWWNKGGGRVIRGLVLRRARERALCMEGL